jgi:glutamine synthetase
MTALDEHRSRNADETALAAIREQIRDREVEFIYYQVVTVTGRIMAKVVPARHVGRNAAIGIKFHRTAISDLQSDRFGEMFGGGTHAPEFNAMPDLDTFSVLPWDTSVARMMCVVYEPDYMPVVGGQVLPTDVRGLLQRTHREFEAETGLELRSGCEPEMTWTGPGLEVKPRPGSSPAYAQAQLERVRPIYQRVIRYAQAMGLDMIEGDYEDPGQIELNFMFDRAERTADRLATYRLICWQVARELGVTASFIPKPVTGAMGNGCHHNISLWRGDENVFADPGRRELHVSRTGLHALGGILAHAPGSMAVMGSTVNSYKRYWDAGQFAPSHVNWGLDNRTCTVRISANGRFEYKLPDAAVNPYLSHTLLLLAMRDGLANQLDPGEPQVGYTGDSAADLQQLPMTLGEAVAAFKEDKVLRAGLPEELYEMYAGMKSDEWARFCSAVTDWEKDMYTEVLQ